MLKRLKVIHLLCNPNRQSKLESKFLSLSKKKRTQRYIHNAMSCIETGWTPAGGRSLSCGSSKGLGWLGVAGTMSEFQTRGRSVHGMKKPGAECFANYVNPFLVSIFQRVLRLLSRPLTRPWCVKSRSWGEWNVQCAQMHMIPYFRSQV